MDSSPHDDIEAISESACLGLLREEVIGRFAVASADGTVDIFPVNYVVDQGTILFRSASGSKIDAVAEPAAAAFEVDHFDWYERTAWSVVVKGTASVLSGHGELFDLFEVEVVPWHPAPKPYFVRIVPDSITGRRFHVAPTRHP